MTFEHLNIIVIGDIMLDCYVHGKSTRMSPEADVPVLMAESTSMTCGGAANVAANIIGLGATCHLMSVCGDDETGDQLLHCLDSIACDTSFIRQSKQRKTTKKTRFFHNQQMLLRLDDEQIEDINDLDKAWLTDKLEELTSKHVIDGIIIQDYNKGVCIPSLNKTIIALARQKGIQVFVDPKIKNYNSYHGVHYFKPNLKELTKVISKEVLPDNVQSIHDGVEALMKYVDADNFIITLGSKGAYFSNSTENGVISTKAIEEADVCGAGDSFISALTLATCSGLPLKKSIQFANIVSGIACQKVGVQAVRIQDYQA